MKVMNIGKERGSEGGRTIDKMYKGDPEKSPWRTNV